MSRRAPPATLCLTAAAAVLRDGIAVLAPAPALARLGTVRLAGAAGAAAGSKVYAVSPGRVTVLRR